MVLTHELTHFRQRDCWTNLLGQMLRAAFWFHPVVWLLVSRASREQELTCDEAVVAAGHSSHDYAAFLLDNVGSLQSSELLACPMAGSGARSLQRRFANLLNPAPRLLLRRRIALSIASFAVLAMSLTLVHPVWSQDGGKRTVYKAGNGVTMPKLLHKVDPEYTPEAKADMQAYAALFLEEWRANLTAPFMLSHAITPESSTCFGREKIQAEAAAVMRRLHRRDSSFISRIARHATVPID